MQRNGYHGHPLSATDKRRNAETAVYRRCYGLGRTRFLGLAKNMTFYSLAAIALNIRKGTGFPRLYGVAQTASGG